ADDNTAADLVVRGSRIRGEYPPDLLGSARSQREGAGSGVEPHKTVAQHALAVERRVAHEDVAVLLVQAHAGGSVLAAEGGEREGGLPETEICELMDPPVARDHLDRAPELGDEVERALRASPRMRDERDRRRNAVAGRVDGQIEAG